MSISLKKFSLCLGFILALFICCQSFARNASNIQAKGIADGAGVWVNMWNYPADADTYCLKLYSNGIRNIFIQTSRSNTQDICNPQGLSHLLDAAHRYQMRVIAWSFNELDNPTADANKVISAANFTNENGQKVDAVAANMEKDLSPAKLNVFCDKVKQNLGNNYPLVAVVYSPLNKAAVVATTPWALLAEQFSTIALMSYWNSKYFAKYDAYQYTLDTIKRIRELSHRPDLDIHIIGDGMGTNAQSVSQFLLACKNGAATSASLYPNQQITTDQLSALAHYPDFFPADGRLRLVAFKALTKSGKMHLPTGTDPSSSINRGQFYQILVHQFYPNSGIQQDENTAFAVLSSAGIISLNSQLAEIDPLLSESISSKEAIDIVARIVDSQGQNKHNHSGQALVAKTSKQARQLFAQPAFAAETSKEAPPLSYLDAAQIILLASGTLK